MDLQTAGIATERPALEPWPPEDLEHLGACPACGGEPRSVFLDGLTDKAFRVAGGEWTLFDCSTCKAAYLDPRPSPSSIGRAYGTYYTHGTFRVDESQFFWRQSGLNARLKTGYLNRRYGYRFPGGIAAGSLVVGLVRRVRLAIDYSIRHLPAPSVPGAKLLDVGCGSGPFVAIARSLGYQASGIDPDPKAVEAGREAGLDVRVGLLPDPSLAERGFEQITMSHTFEHLHRPREALEQCFDLLVPGGRLWISQPNLGALGLKRFGRDWRGLEPPRHLSLYGFDSLSKLLDSAGFADIRLLPAEEAAAFYYRQSSAMRRGLDPYEAPDDPEAAAEAEAANRRSRRSPELSESLTLTAIRP
ncbi:MAG TPA: class I SAM-dependent methyltransferase [Allosphingosinicella sp.]|jgi:2-polyprenyl-3-methyl-5-hydroxy-6-metoxy-1,4-benzoquinol methylase